VLLALQSHICHQNLKMQPLPVRQFAEFCETLICHQLEPMLACDYRYQAVEKLFALQVGL
jgi:hypothetical protein